MPALDTSTLVRLLVADDAAQTNAARRLIDRMARTAETLFVPLTVVVQLEWVLRSRYLFSTEVVGATLSSLLETRELEFQDEVAVEHALHFYRTSRADFAECLHLGCSGANGRLPFLTFDQQARLPGAERLS